MTEFIARVCHGESQYEVIIKTNDEGHYKAAQDFARSLIEHKKPQTNADRIRAMSDEELAEFIRKMVDGSNTHDVACYGCIHYGTHHSDPENKGTDLYECGGCQSEGIGLDVLKWLMLPVREAHKGDGGGDNA